MLEGVVDEEAEVVGEKERERPRAVEDEIGRMRLRVGAEAARKKGGDAVADPRRRNDGPADDGAQSRKPDDAIGEVGEGRAMEQDPAREDRAHERLHDDRPAAAPAP